MPPHLKKQHLGTVLIATPETKLVLRIQPSESGDSNEALVNACVFLNIPLELLSEISKSLHPLDLLSLLRTCKFFRNILRDKGFARPIWRVSMHLATKLPPAPDVFPYPRLAVILFETSQCMLCTVSIPASTITDFELRIRSCSRCRQTHTASFVESFAPKVEGYPFYDLIPSTVPSGRIPGSYLVADLKAVKATIADAGFAGTRLEEFVSKRKLEMAELRRFASVCRAWEATTEIERKAKDEITKADRNTYIRRKLLSLGWGDVLAVMKPPNSALDRLPLVNIAQPVTQSVWTEICPKLEEFMARERTEERKRHQEALRKQAAKRMAKGKKALQKLAQQNKKGKTSS
ncbi:hypothetical protein R3P38DRAFT_3085369 [Favolaschia claudopus]|uniref:F-box domain-containing protein n=1 Tax=Favolaschia claudopus TaxID=2862362 RepID=A0AAV9ZUL2_9AGAR